MADRRVRREASAGLPPTLVYHYAVQALSGTPDTGSTYSGFRFDATATISPVDTAGNTWQLRVGASIWKILRYTNMWHTVQFVQLSKVETTTFEGELFDGLPSGLLERTHFLEAVDLKRALLDQHFLELWELPIQFRFESHFSLLRHYKIIVLYLQFRILMNCLVWQTSKTVTKTKVLHSVYTGQRANRTTNLFTNESNFRNYSTCFAIYCQDSNTLYCTVHV